jgi:hypothetical protein
VRRGLGAAACVAIVLTGLTATGAVASGGAPRWTASYLEGAPAQSYAVALSPDGSTVFTTGITNFGPTGRMGTLAYDAATGQSRWVDTFPGNSAGAYAVGHKLAVSPDGSTLYVSGYTVCTSHCDSSSFEGYVTIAYDVSTGHRDWVSRVAGVGGTPTSVNVSPDGSQVFLSATDGFDGTVTVGYDATDGHQEWKTEGTKAEGYYGGGMAVSPDGSTVYVTATAPTDDASCFDAGGYATTAYSASDGSVEWSTTYGVSGSAGSLCGTATDLTLSSDGSTVFVTGYGSQSADEHSGTYEAGTVAYDAATGNQVWATDDDDINVLGGDTVVSLGVSPDGSQVFVSGDDCAHGGCSTASYSTIAYDATNGDRQWLSRYDGGGRAFESDLATSPDGSTVYITGQESMPCFAGCSTAQVDAPLVAYDAATGDERWATTYADNGGQALAVSPDGSSVYLAGSSMTSAAASRGLSRSRKSAESPNGYATTRFNTGPGAGTFQDAETSVRLDAWRGFYDKTAVGGSYRASRTAGNLATFTTPKVTSFTWLTHLGPDQGKARLVVDGRNRGIVDLHASTRSTHAVTVSGLARKAHRIKVKVLGRHDATSTGSWVAVDGFAFHAGRGIAQESSPSIHFDSWSGSTSRRASGGSFRESGARVAKLSLDFQGRTFRWITATGPAYGRAKVVIDGHSRGTVDLYRRSQHWRVAITYRGLAPGQHRLVIRPLGKKDAASRSTKVVVDAVVVRRHR